MTTKYDAQKHTLLRRQLQEMELARAQQLKPLVDAIKAVVPPDGLKPHSDGWDAVAEQFAAHADALRDTLAPFDSGMRQARANDSCEGTP